MAQIESPINQTVVIGEAIAAARSGRKDLARQMLREITGQNPNHEQAFLWLAALAETPAAAMVHLQRVLELNPNNQQALNAMEVHRMQIDSRMRKEAPRQTGPAVKADEEATRRLAAALPGARTVTLSPGPRSAGLRSVAVTNPVPAPLNLPAPAEAKRSETKVEAKNDPATPRTIPRPTWACPLCEAENIKRVNKCHRCGALQDLGDIRALAENRGVDEALVTKGADKWLHRLIGGPSLEAHVNVARAYLNLNRSAEAVIHLERASEMRPADVPLKEALSALRARKMVLAVDDSPTVRRLISVSLERKGYRVVTAEDGMQALARLAEHMPSLVLLDIGMPKMDGYEVCKVIKRNQTWKQLPVLMLSGKDGIFDKLKGRMAGAAGYIAKPFDVAMLVQALEKQFGDAVLSKV